MANTRKNNKKNKGASASKFPPFYKVILFKDTTTPIEFMVDVMIACFGKSREEAIELTFKMQEDGKASCGRYCMEIAETKTAEVVEWARSQEYPLQCIIEKEEGLSHDFKSS